MLILFYKRICETNELFLIIEFCKTLLYCEEDNINNYVILFAKWERKWKWLEFSLSWKTLKWFTPTTSTIAINRNNQEHLKRKYWVIFSPLWKKSIWNEGYTVSVSRQSNLLSVTRLRMKKSILSFHSL